MSMERNEPTEAGVQYGISSSPNDSNLQGTPPNLQYAISETEQPVEPQSAPVVPTIAISGQKRPRALSRMKSMSIHKPFRSPVRSIQQQQATSSSEPTTSTAVATTDDKDSCERVPQPRQLGTASKIISMSNKSRGRRLPFRSPAVRDHQGGHGSGDTPHSRLLQMQTLQSRIAELQSSIRKGKQVLQQQQKCETSLQELTAKWRKASHDGTHTLLEKYAEQEQMYGGGWGGDNMTSNFPATSGKPGFYSQDDEWGYNASAVLQKRRSHQYLDQDQLDTMEQRMDAQDVEQDLPTVEEAIRARAWPDIGTAPGPRIVTKMQKLLLGLGIDLAVIGYDPEQDAFLGPPGE
ncbi:hypothetical protein BG011_006013 [Mortierella polycephala]|uniref:Swi5-dependent recombination DNA repair protein 1 n=1 Tax=Mortierella polycephala TaxID=41804 RepID=A0A9P6U0L4_9FUNG|nr:hypothetical protein BG011_006013 [Mortierella polycephala]